MKVQVKLKFSQFSVYKIKILKCKPCQTFNRVGIKLGLREAVERRSKNVPIGRLTLVISCRCETKLTANLGLYRQPTEMFKKSAAHWLLLL